jgi:hypothetical protein
MAGIEIKGFQEFIRSKEVLEKALQAAKEAGVSITRSSAEKDRKDKLPVWSRIFPGSLVDPVGASDKTLYVNQEQKTLTKVFYSGIGGAG